MFDQLSQKMSRLVDGIKNRGRLTEENLDAAVRDIRMALLEADVHVRVVREFTERVKLSAIGQKLLNSVTPTEQFTKIVYDALVATLGENQEAFSLRDTPPVVILMVGLQGSGKTTTSTKLAQHLKKAGRTPYLIPADVSRPAAIEQLSILGKRAGIPVYPTSEKEKKPHKFVPDAIKLAKKSGCDTVIVDTAGRLQLDEALMDELSLLKKAVSPRHILLAVDAMTGQEAVKVASAFHERLSLSGLVLTKLDGDARGGAALSIKSVTGVPIYFSGNGEGLDDLSPFYPDRIASRILDRGDIVGLVEKAQEMADETVAKRMEEKLARGQFDLDDFRGQLRQMKKLGSVGSLLTHIPGAQRLTQGVDTAILDRDMVKKIAIIDSMTPKERRRPDLLNGKRRRRIANGSGTHPADVNRLLKEFDQMNKMMKQFKSGGLGAMRRMLGQ